MAKKGGKILPMSKKPYRKSYKECRTCYSSPKRCSCISQVRVDRYKKIKEEDNHLNDIQTIQYYLNKTFY